MVVAQHAVDWLEQIGADNGKSVRSLHVYDGTTKVGKFGYAHSKGGPYDWPERHDGYWLETRRREKGIVLPRLNVVLHVHHNKKGHAVCEYKAFHKIEESVLARFVQVHGWPSS